MKHFAILLLIVLFFCTQKSKQTISGCRVYKVETLKEWDARTKNDSLRKAFEAKGVDTKELYKKVNKPLPGNRPVRFVIKRE